MSQITHQPTNAREYLESLRSEILAIKAHLDRLDPPDSTTPPQDDPILTLLASILTAIRDQQTSDEVMHQRIDAIARYVPAAARAVSGKS